MSSSSSFSKRSTKRKSWNFPHARHENDRYALDQQQSRLQRDPPGETGIHLSKRQLEMMQRRNAQRSGNSSDGGASERRARFPSRPRNRKGTNDGTGIDLQHVADRTVDRQKKDPPSAASIAGAKEMRPTTASAREDDKESQRELVRSLLGMKGSRRNINNRGSRNDPVTKQTSNVSVKDKFRQRIFPRGRSNKSPVKGRTTDRNFSEESQNQSPYALAETTEKDSLQHDAVENSRLKHDSLGPTPDRLVDDENYNNFASDLRLEVIGSHSQLAASFHSCVTGRTSVVRSAQKRHLLPESVRVLHDLHSHLQDVSPRASSTQMVNDRAYSKEKRGSKKKRSAGSASNPDGDSRLAGTELAQPAHHKTRPKSTTQQILSASRPDIHSATSSLVNTSSSPGDMLKTQRSSPSNQSTAKQNKVVSDAHMEPQTNAISTEIPSDPTMTHAHMEKGWASVLRPNKESTQETPKVIGTNVLECNGPAKTTAQEPNLKETIDKRKQARTRSPIKRVFDAVAPGKLSDDNGRAAELKLTPPRLRKVPKEMKAISPKPKAAPWANVSLRPVSRTVKKPAPLTTKESDIASNVEQTTSKTNTILPATTAEAPAVENVSKKSTTPVVIDVANIDEEAIDRLTPPEPLEMYDETDVSDPDVLSVFALQPSALAGTKKFKVILGKQYIRVVEHNEGETHGIVKWKVLRDALEPDGMNLNMKSLTVRLILKGGSSRALLFPSSDECLRFVTLFYNASSELPSHVVNSASSLPPSVPPSEVVEAESTCSSVRLESLNDEEQSVLEKYRELRLTKGHDEALQATIIDNKLPDVTKASSGSSRSGSLSELSEEEEKSANIYRSMLKKSLPIGAVKHRMVLEGATPKVVDLIVLEAESLAPLPTITAGEFPSSPVSTFTATSVGFKPAEPPLSAAEEVAVKRYKMMLKNGVPPDAVRHKLTQDGAATRVASAVFSQIGEKESEKVNEESSFSQGERTAIEKFKKMLKLGIPPDAVRHKMKQEEVDSKIVSIVLGDPPQESKQVQGGTSALTTEEEGILAKYRKMLKLGIGADAVGHKMTQDGVDGKLVNLIVGSDSGFKTPSVKSESENSKAKSKTSGLSKEEEAIAAEYRKLLKRQVPRDALQFRMVKEGVSRKVMIAVLGQSAVNSCDQSKTSSSSSTASTMINLHWNPYENAPEGSVWIMNAESPDLDRCDFAELLERFQKKPATSKKLPTKSEASGSKGKAKLLDLTRSNNIAISLKSFKEFDYDELGKILAFLDPCRKIRGERAQFLRDLLPTLTELRIITEYHGSDDRLVPAELWFRKLRGTKRLDVKASVIRTMEMFTADASEVRANFRILGQVCTQVVESKKLQDVLKMVLKIGNMMNQGTRMGGASGFKFDSLLRLTQTKTSDGKMTLLDQLVQIFCDRKEGQTLELIVDFPELHTASRFLINDMKNEVKILADALLECRTELKNMEKDQSCPGEEKKPKKAPATGDPRAQLFAAITARGTGDDDSKSANFQKRDQFLAAMEAKKKTAHSTSEVSTSKAGSQIIENNISGGITRLRNFIESVDESFERLQKQRDDSLEACRKLSTYCGESGGISSTTMLLDVLSQFVRNIELSVKKRNEIAKRAGSKAKKSLPAEKDPKTEVVAEDSSTSGKSLVLMVNDVLRNANPVFKENFKKGRVVHDPSATLQEIYDREQLLILESPSAASTAESSNQERSTTSETIQADKTNGSSTKQEEAMSSSVSVESTGDPCGIPTHEASENASTDVEAQSTSPKSVDQVRLALEEISMIASRETLCRSEQQNRRSSLVDRARDKRIQKTVQQHRESNDDEEPSPEPKVYESAFARSARKKRLQMRKDRTPPTKA